MSKLTVTTIDTANGTTDLTISTGNTSNPSLVITASDGLITYGNSTVNVTANSSLVKVGGNAQINSSAFQVGNSTVNAITNSTAVVVANSSGSFRWPYAGAIVQSVYAEYTTNAALTTQIPIDDTIPQITEGTEILTASITPISATNKLRIRYQGVCTASTQSHVATALFQDSTANALAARAQYIAGADHTHMATIEYEMTAGTTSSTTFRIRVGANSAVTVRLNGLSTARTLGGAQRATLVIEEIVA